MSVYVWPLLLGLPLDTIEGEIISTHCFTDGTQFFSRLVCLDYLLTPRSTTANALSWAQDRHDEYGRFLAWFLVLVPLLLSESK